MEKINKYLESGFLEDYCLGLVTDDVAKDICAAAEKYPEIKQRIEELEQTLINSVSQKPSPGLKEKILGDLEKLHFLPIDIADPPLIDNKTDLEDWNNALYNIQPNKDYGYLKTHFLKDTPTHQLCIAWLYESLEEDGHDSSEFTECFYIVEGSCVCNIGGKTAHLKAGDYLEIPVNTRHTIKKTSENLPYVKALIQRIKKVA